MKALILCLLVTSTFAGEILKQRKDKIVFRLDGSLVNVERGDILTIKRKGRSVGEVQFLIMKSGLGAARVVSGNPLKGDIITSDEAALDELGGGESFAMNDDFEDDFSDEVVTAQAATRGNSEAEVGRYDRFVKEETVDEVMNTNTGDVNLLFGLGSNSLAEIELNLPVDFGSGDENTQFTFSPEGMNSNTFQVGYFLSENSRVKVGMTSGSGLVSEKCLNNATCAGGVTITSDGDYLNTSIGFDYFFGKNIYATVGFGTSKFNIIRQNVNGGELSLTGTSFTLGLGTKLNLSNNVFLQLEGNYINNTYSKATFTSPTDSKKGGGGSISQANMNVAGSIGIAF
jgi:opacity protein-like surface antigen